MHEVPTEKGMEWRKEADEILIRNGGEVLGTLEYDAHLAVFRSANGWTVELWRYQNYSLQNEVRYSKERQTLYVMHGTRAAVDMRKLKVVSIMQKRHHDFVIYCEATSRGNFSPSDRPPSAQSVRNPIGANKNTGS